MFSTVKTAESKETIKGLKFQAQLSLSLLLLCAEPVFFYCNTERILLSCGLFQYYMTLQKGCMALQLSFCGSAGKPTILHSPSPSALPALYLLQGVAFSGSDDRLLLKAPAVNNFLFPYWVWVVFFVWLVGLSFLFGVLGLFVFAHLFSSLNWRQCKAEDKSGWGTTVARLP